MAQQVLLKKSMVVDKQPTPASLEFGELAVNYASGSGKSFLAAKKYDGTLAIFPEKQYIENTFATKDSMDSTEASVAKLQKAINFVSGSTSALSASVVNNYWTSATTAEKITEAKDAAVTSAYTAAVAAANSYTDEATTPIVVKATQALTAAQSAFNYTSAVSATVNSNFATNASVGTASANAITSAVSLAVKDAVESANSYTDNAIAPIIGRANQALNAANSAFNYTNAVSATVRDNYATNESVGTASANAITSAVSIAFEQSVTSANTYTDNKFETINAGVSNAINKANSAFNYTAAVSATVNANFATNEALGAASARTFESAFTASVTSANSYTDDKFETVNANVANAMNKANSAYNYTNAVSATVKNGYWTSATTEEKINAASNSAISLAQSAYNYADTVKSEIDTLNQFKVATNNRLNTIESGYTTKELLNITSGAAVTSAYTMAKDYIDSKIGDLEIDSYLTVESANSVFSVFNNEISKINASARTISGSVVALSAGVISQLSTVYVYKGTKNTHGDLPTSGNKKGDVWNVISGYNGSVPGSNWAWDGENWDPLGGTLDLSEYATTESLSSLEAKVTKNTNSINFVSGQTSALSNTLKTYPTSAMVNNAIGVASGKTYHAAYGASSAYTDSKIASLDQRITTNKNAIDFISGQTSALSNTMKTYPTSGMVDSAIARASASTYHAAYAASSAYTDSKMAALDQRITANKNSINYVSGQTSALSNTLKTNYPTSGMVDSAIARASAATYHAAYGDASAYTDSKIASLDQRITANKNSINFVSGQTSALSNTLKTNYPTSGMVDSAIARASASTYHAAYGASSAYTDSKIDTLDQRITSSNNAINFISGQTSALSNTLKTYPTSGMVDNAIAVASAKTYHAAYGDSSAYTDSKLSEFDSKLVSISGKVVSLSSSVVTNYATKEQVSGCATSAIESAVTYVNQVISGLSIGDYLTVESANSIVSTLESADNALTNKINFVSGQTSALSNTLKTYPTSAMVNNAIGIASGKTYYAASAAASAYVESRIGTLDSKINGNTNAINFVSGQTSALSNTLKTYPTSAMVNNAIGIASGKTYHAAYGASSAYTDSRINTVNSQILSVSGAVTAFSASVINKISGVYNFKGTKNTHDDLPATGNEKGDVWNVVSAYNGTLAGTNWAWTGSEWDALGGTIDMSAFLTSESAASMYDSIVSRIGNFALSSTVESWIEQVIDDEEVTAAALVNLDRRIRELSGANDVFITLESAASVFSTLEAADNDLNNKINFVSGQTSALSNTMKSYPTSGMVNNAIGRASAATFYAASAAASAYVESRFGTLDSKINGNTAAINFVSGQTSALSNTLKTYPTSGMVNNAIGRASAATYYAASAAASAYVESRFGTLDSKINDNVNAINFVSGQTSALSNTLKTYPTSGMVNNAIGRASAATFYAASAAASAYVESRFGTLDSKINDNVNAVNYVSAQTSALSNTLKSNYPTSGMVNNAIGRASAATYYAASAASSAYTNSVRDSLQAKIDANTAAINRISGATSGIVNTLTGTYWTSAVTKQKIDAAVTSAYTASTAYTSNNYLTKTSAGTAYDTLDGKIANAVESAVTLSASVVSFSAGVVNQLVTLFVYKGTKDTYAQLPTTGNKKGDVYNVVSGYNETLPGTNWAWDGSKWDPLGGSLDTSVFLTGEDKDELESKITTVSEGVSALSASVISTYATEAMASSYAAAALANAMEYVDDRLSNIELDDYLTAASAASAYDTLDASITALSSNTVSAIDEVYKVIVDDELVTAAIMNDLNDRILQLSGGSLTLSGYASSALVESKFDAVEASMRSFSSATVSGLTNLYNIIIEDEEVEARAFNDLHDSILTLSAMVGSTDTEYATEGYVDDAISLLEQRVYQAENVISEDEYVTSAALNDLDDRLYDLSGTVRTINANLENAEGRYTVTTASTKNYLLGAISPTVKTGPDTVHTSMGCWFSGSNIYQSSDERLKNFIGDVDVDLDRLKDIPKKYFTWKDGSDSDVNIGTSAQKLNEIYPSLVDKSNPDHLGVSYDKMSIIALAAIDKLYEELKAMREENQMLRERISTIEEKLK